MRVGRHGSRRPGQSVVEFNHSSDMTDMEDTRFTKEKGEFDYKVIQETLERLCEATANLLEREWPAKYERVDSARVTFFQSLRIAINTYNTIFFIIADEEYYGRRKIYALALPPLVRTLFEQLIAFIFLIQDIPTYIPWLFKTGHTEHIIQLRHVQKYHGMKPEWTDYIDNLKAQISREENSGYLTQQEMQNPYDNIGRWPTPGRMHKKLKKDKTSPQDTLDYIEYINDWLYRELSAQTHLNVSGLTMKGVHFSIEDAKVVFGDTWEEERNRRLEEYRQKQVWLAIIIMMAIVSEIEGHFHFGRNQKARELWTYLNQYSDIALDFWETRYAALLPA